MKGVTFLNVNSATENTAGQSEPARQPAKALDKDAFLRLFIEQLKNQDPMSPQDSNAFMAQMAQFSMLEQMANLEKEFSQMKTLQEASEASSMLGRTVTVQTEGSPVTGQVEKVILSGEDVKIAINGNSYLLGQVIEIK